MKEIQLRPQTEEHDLDYKFKNAKQFLEDGDKVKITIMFRGREITYADQGFKMMRQLADQVKDIAILEAHPKLEGKKLIMILAPGAASNAKKVTIGGPGPVVKPLVTPNKPAGNPGPTPNAGPTANPAPSGSPGSSGSGEPST